MNTDKNRELLWRTVPFVMAMLLLALTGIPASAIFGREKAAPAADAGAPIAQSIDVRVYRGIPYTGTLAAIDREGGEVSFAIAEPPSKGTVPLDGAPFVYTSAKNKTGVDRFTYTATDAAGSTSAPAEVRITIARAKCGVTYDDMAESAAYTAAVDLAEHGGDGYVSMRDVARRQELSDKYAGQVMSLLSRAGLVSGVTGKGGGYRLTRKPEEYPLGEILRLTEGSLAPVACLEEGAHPCDRAAQCRTLPVWNRLGQIMGDYLDSVTLRDLLKTDE